MSTIYSAIDRGDALIYDGVAYEKKGQNFGNITSGGVYGQTDISGVTFTLDDSGVEGGSNHRVWTAAEMAVARYVAANFGQRSAFQMAALSQTSRNWIGMCAAPNGDIYASVTGGDIYKQSGGTGDFVALSQTSRNWSLGMAAAPNGDIYAAAWGDDIYKQSGGTGDFVALSQGARSWNGMAVAPNGDIYATAWNDDIYKQSGGSGNFVTLSQGARSWHGMCAAPNGDVYACAYNGDIYKQSGGVGNFVALSQTSRLWMAMCAAPDGDVYAAVWAGDIYKQSGGSGNFVALSQTSRYWCSMCAAPNGDVYACVLYGGDIYKYNPHIFLTAPYDGIARVHHEGAGTGAFAIAIDGTPYAVSSGNVPQADAIPVPLSAGQELVVAVGATETTMFYLPAVYP